MEKIKEIEIEGNPDCVVGCPEGFIVSTYNLDKSTNEKSGSLQCFDMSESILWKTDVNKGILDVKLAQDSMITCCSDGSLSAWRSSSMTSNIQITDSCLSYLTIYDSKAVTSSLDGWVYHVDLESLQVKGLKKNSYEIWVVECKDNLVFIPISMGKLLVEDLRTGDEVARMSLHENDISSLVVSDSVVYSGSYDGEVCVSDIRSWKTSEKIEIGGGVWRMALRERGIVTANMEEGFKYRKDGVISRVESGSLAYGLSQLTNEIYLGCSFYDSKLLFLKVYT